MKQSIEVSNLETNVSETAPAQTGTPQQPVDGTPEQPLTEPTIPKKKDKKKWLLPVVIGLIVIILGFASYFIYRFIQPTKQVQSPDSTSATNETGLTTPTSSVESEEPGVPELNALYIGSYEEKEVLIERTCVIPPERLIGYNNKESISHITKPSEAKYIVFITAVDTEEAYNSTTPVDFRKIDNPRKIFTYSRCDFEVAGPEGAGVYNSNKDKIYVSLNLGDLNYKENKIFQIDLNSSNYKELWSHEIGNPNPEKYDGYYGDAYIEQVVQDKYIVFSIWDCTGCSPPSPDRTSVVLNVDTLAELYLGLVGNVQINIKDNSLTYQSLSPFKESCEGCFGMCPGCRMEEDGVFRKTVLKPTGDLITKTLP